MASAKKKKLKKKTNKNKGGNQMINNFNLVLPTPEPPKTVEKKVGLLGSIAKFFKGAAAFLQLI